MLVSGLAGVAPRAAAGPGEASPDHRLFLVQGGDLVARGDPVRVGDRVTLLLPLDASGSAPHPRLISVPAAAVDWETTGRYAAAVRAARYAAAHGAADFERLSADVARALNAIAFTDDPQARRVLAQRTRERLLAWTERSHGYRADDIAEIVALLDAAVAADNAAGHLELGLVAITGRPHLMPILPAPNQQEIVARALTASRLTPVPEERIAILRDVLAVLEDPGSDLGAEWRALTRAVAVRDLDAEAQHAQAFAVLRADALARATAGARRADVRGVESVLDDVRLRYAALGARYPGQLAALSAALQQQLADARARRLEQDRQWYAASIVRDYGARAQNALAGLAAARGTLEDIRLLAGPPVAALAGLDARLSAAAGEFGLAAPPAELRRVHELLRQALLLAAGAASGRQQAVRDGDLDAAWDAAAAAAGALLLLDHAAAQLDPILPSL